jgi:hypothetical protein
MRPIEPDYRQLCEYEKVRALGLEDEECVHLLRRGTRRCHVMARRYLLAEGLNAGLDFLSKFGKLSKSAAAVAGALSLIDVGAYSYTIDLVHNMLESAVKGFGPTWHYHLLTLSESLENTRLSLDGEMVDVWYNMTLKVHFSDVAKRGWVVIFGPNHAIMKYHQYRRWADVYRKWQDKALAAMAARTL